MGRIVRGKLGMVSIGRDWKTQQARWAGIYTQRTKPPKHITSPSVSRTIKDLSLVLRSKKILFSSRPCSLTVGFSHFTSRNGLSSHSRLMSSHVSERTIISFSSPSVMSHGGFSRLTSGNVPVSHSRINLPHQLSEHKNIAAFSSRCVSLAVIYFLLISKHDSSSLDSYVSKVIGFIHLGSHNGITAI